MKFSRIAIGSLASLLIAAVAMASPTWAAGLVNTGNECGDPSVPSVAVQVSTDGNYWECATCEHDVVVQFTTSGDNTIMCRADCNYNVFVTITGDGHYNICAFPGNPGDSEEATADEPASYQNAAPQEEQAEQG